MVIFPESDILDEDRSLAETLANQSLNRASPFYQDQSFITSQEWKLVRTNLNLEQPLSDYPTTEGIRITDRSGIQTMDMS